jgi:hypothetical protein
MLGSEFKRGVVTTLERVFKSSNYAFDTLEFQWYGTGASIQFHQYSGTRIVDATFRFPNVDDNGQIPRKTMPKFVAMALHELGHAWHTDNAPWDVHRGNPVLCRLINGLEDPRIEKKVIDSCIAANARSLFENLINEMMGGTYVQPDDFGNLAFQLAVEGRRMNGYKITVPPVLNESRYKEPMQWALKKAHRAKSTLEIVAIAVELLERLNALKPVAPPPEGGKDEPPDGPSDDDGGDTGEDGEAGEDGGDGGGDDTGEDGDGGEGEDGETGEEGETGDGNEPGDSTDQPGDDVGNEAGNEAGDEDDENKGPGAGAGTQERDVEPDMGKELQPYSAEVDTTNEPRPACQKPTLYKFTWD